MAAEQPPSPAADGSITISNGNNNNGKGKKVEPEYGKNRHGLEIGTYFVPKDLELFSILKCKLVRGELTGPLNDVFSEINILEFHPAVLHSTYKENEEDGYIYFFSTRAFATKTGNKKRPVRVAHGGTWKASGGSKTVRSKKVGGVEVGQKLTMVFYEKRFDGDRSPLKTNWGMHEFTKIIPGSKNKLEDLAVYRLYKIKRDDENGAQNVNTAATASSTDKPSASSAMELPPPPQLCLAGSSSAMALQGLAGPSSAMALAPLQPPMPMPGLAGGMMMPSMADQVNVAPYAAFQTANELMQEWNQLVAHGRGAAPPCASTSSWPALPSSSSPMQHLDDGYLAMLDIEPSFFQEPVLMEPIAAIPPMESSPAPLAVDNCGNSELADVDDGGFQIVQQHGDHHQQQEESQADGVNCYDAMVADGDAQQCTLAVAAAGTEFDDLAQLNLNFGFDDGVEISFQDVFGGAEIMGQHDP